MHLHAKAAELLEELDLGVSIAEIDTFLETARVETSAFADLLNDKVDLVPYGLMIQRTFSTKMLQFTQKLWRLETMKISKFVWSVLVAFATVALIAPQQVEAIIVDGRVKGQIEFTGSGTITESTGINSNGINSNGINELDFNGQFFPHGPLSVTNATGDFIPIVGSQAIFNLAIRWTGSGSSVTLLDVLPGVGGPAWSIPIVGANGFATGTFFSLKSVTFDEDSLTLIGMGTTQMTSGDPLVQKHSAARIVIQGTGQDFTYNNLTVVTTAVFQKSAQHWASSRLA